MPGLLPPPPPPSPWAWSTFPEPPLSSEPASQGQDREVPKCPQATGAPLCRALRSHREDRSRLTRAVGTEQVLSDPSTEEEAGREALLLTQPPSDQKTQHPNPSAGAHSPQHCAWDPRIHSGMTSTSAPKEQQENKSGADPKEVGAFQITIGVNLDQRDSAQSAQTADQHAGAATRYQAPRALRGRRLPS